MRALFEDGNEMEKLLDEALRMYKSTSMKNKTYNVCTCYCVYILGDLSKQWRDNEEMEKVIFVCDD